ncbi:hypothetical protein A1O7_08197 [Cladophialophora yegresii CBS 114405]|uniref:SUN domain-containing protein n=1 Tax=Cladophialophora yegresii CBS 114405 TaxID=1182544 RepID=W9VSW4_9EURO|nr:uncharacterized protein A1O7_08197 [Cladophialophora yegresii CBS 114405]EXJ55271.1 hypothetical protein A1O7_08197 [Cladophialophora yegresii CBS 114405]
MAPRRSTARASSATPVRGATPAKRPTRASSALEPEDAIPRRSNRGASQQPSIANGDVNNPRLPEVQIQQSYAYGSTKAPVLPTQLIARSRMNLLQMAETIDAGVDQAEQHLQHHIEETRANLQKDAREERARRRASREPSQEGSVASDEREQSRSQRVAAWASSVDSPQLNGIAEEDQEDEQEVEHEEESPARSTPDNASDKGTDPSSFPSGMFDHSYNYERGLRKPNITIRQPQEPFSVTISRALKERTQRARRASFGFASSIQSWLQRLWTAIGESIRNLPNSPLISIMTTLLFTLLFIGAASLSFCYVYNTYVCNPLPTSLPGQMLQRYCGTCARSPGRAPLNFTLGGGDDLSKLSVAINQINHQLRDLETRINDKVDSQHAAVDKGIDALRKQHSELSNHVANLKLGGGRSNPSSGDVASPVIPKINYLAPNNGAMLEPRLTSPTMQRPLAFVQRVLLRVFFAAGYVSKPPITALSPWQDVGDCWCASSAPGADTELDQADTMRLGVTVTELIYPTEVVVENYPSGGSLLPGSTPRVIELWADFGHLDSREWKSLNIRQMQSEGGSPIGPTYALVGQMEYDASSEASHVQAFPLDVNQDTLAYAAQNFVVRVTENYGAEYTCLYRVRLHGVPVFEHASERNPAA